MLLTIVQAGDPVLRQVAHALTVADIHSRRIQGLMRDMQETMRHAPGVGLAAPQIGESLQLVVVEDRAECPPDVPAARWAEWERGPVPFQVLVNPVLTSCAPRLASFYEGCLSVPGYRCVVPRSYEVCVEALDATGKPLQIRASGWYARILQHEIDHLAGVLCVDRMLPRSLATTDNFDTRWKREPMEKIQQELGQGGRL